MTELNVFREHNINKNSQDILRAKFEFIAQVKQARVEQSSVGGSNELSIAQRHLEQKKCLMTLSKFLIAVKHL